METFEPALHRLLSMVAFILNAVLNVAIWVQKSELYFEVSGQSIVNLEFNFTLPVNGRESDQMYASESIVC